MATVNFLESRLVGSGAIYDVVVFKNRLHEPEALASISLPK
jgi:hypothetical protein